MKEVEDWLAGQSRRLENQLWNSWVRIGGKVVGPLLEAEAVRHERTLDPLILGVFTQVEADLLVLLMEEGEKPIYLGKAPFGHINMEEAVRKIVNFGSTTNRRELLEAAGFLGSLNIVQGSTEFGSIYISYALQRSRRWYTLKDAMAFVKKCGISENLTITKGRVLPSRSLTGKFPTFAAGGPIRELVRNLVCAIVLRQNEVIEKYMEELMQELKWEGVAQNRFETSRGRFEAEKERALARMKEVVRDI